MEKKKVVIDGVEYTAVVEQDTDNYVIIRSAQAGVFAGILVKRDGGEVTLRDARRLWYWAGAASLSELAINGVKRPKECKFPVSIPSIVILGVIEVIPCTTKARKSIEGVPIWEA